MLPRTVDLASAEIERAETAKQSRRPDDYCEKTRRKRFPDQLQGFLLNFLRKRLADEKAKDGSGHALGAAIPWSKEPLYGLSSQREAASAIDPSSQVAGLYHALCEKLVSTVKNGVQKTTLTLDSSAFRSSLFRGATITIVEYSTAPKIFNIQFTADPKAIALLETHAADLQNALNNNKELNFTVGRIDTSLRAKEKKHSVEAIGSEGKDKDHA